MPTLEVLRVARIVLFVFVALMLIVSAVHGRVQWWRMFWMLALVLHELTFFIIVLAVQLRTGQTATPLLVAWSAWLDIHQALAFMIYIAVARKSARDDNGRAIADIASRRTVDYQRLTRVAEERKREHEWQNDAASCGGD